MKVRNMKRGLTKNETTEASPDREGPQSICPFYNEVYENPLHEDWIQCSICKEWLHVACSSYEGVGWFNMIIVESSTYKIVFVNLLKIFGKLTKMCSINSFLIIK